MLGEYINTEFRPERGKTPCWSFCEFVYMLLGRDIADSVWNMQRTDKPGMYSVVLFKYSNHIWHTAIIWPDYLHILHAVERPSGIYILKDRLNNDNLRLVKGYYV